MDGQQAGAEDSSKELIAPVAKDSSLQEEITTQDKPREAVILSSNYKEPTVKEKLHSL